MLLVIVLAAAAAAAGFLVTDHLRRPQPTAQQRSVPTPSAYAGADAAPRAAAATTTPVPSRAAIATALRPALRAAGLGPRVLAQVVDARTGSTLLDRSGGTGAAPASTLKLTTAAAVLAVHAATDRIRTVARSDGRGTLVLVGAGDPTLSAAGAGERPRYAGAARLADLAAQVRRAKVSVRRIVVDDSAYRGATVSPDWAAEDVPSEYGAAITPLLADGGRADPDDDVRSATPDVAAGKAFARLLGRSSLPVTRTATTTATGRVVAAVRSAPIATLVEQMLLQSDNVIAESLARQVARSQHATASFPGAAAAVRAVLRDRLGVDIGGGLRDGSGLAPADRISPAALTALLHAVVRSSNQGVRGITGALPVAAWSGSLAPRYLSGASRAGAGLVRAKTGTLTGVSTLAGLVHTPRGGLVAFAVFADRNDDTAAAQAALDALVARLATCRC
ncbi:D-alanyl-D-alanine carboxypeptidase / D-alanyl-D-alanine-endopeptidase (penicillin-binding protein 4) [Jatrophihabitans endophyticus]|uniref:D-alanyl-D-alanine carboxypeptidase / D-alanyl-D-alanine-endopeptidase (Penicillin-binding protein 4) n=1 Tax=Jatrophihabitans endophyticus TaxID=1206085 RepID=A0A1M5R3V7_9ACTN|nr:D-alanyl-D-alanine carboxypeptidase / D-alanyl-D-alanine-endopeptidase (penicillin-binding protein 4) [Jatrophihabitans endophyticus]